MCLRYLRDSIRCSVGEDSSFRRAAFSKGYMYIMIRGQLSVNQEDKYTFTRNLFPPTLSQTTVYTPLVKTTRYYWTPSIPWTPLDSLDYIVGYHLHLVRRSFVECNVYHAASSSPSHTAQLLLHRSIRRIQHSVIEPVVYCTTSSSLSCSTRQQSERFRQTETGGVPRKGGEECLEGRN